MKENLNLSEVASHLLSQLINTLAHWNHSNRLLTPVFNILSIQYPIIEKLVGNIQQFEAYYSSIHFLYALKVYQDCLTGFQILHSAIDILDWENEWVNETTLPQVRILLKHFETASNSLQSGLFVDNLVDILKEECYKPMDLSPSCHNYNNLKLNNQSIEYSILEYNKHTTDLKIGFDCDANHAMIEYYYKGYGTKVNLAKAKLLLQYAWNKLHSPLVLDQLGKLYDQEGNIMEAFRNYVVAGSLGIPSACKRLSVMYRDGEIIMDAHEALRWCDKGEQMRMLKNAQ
ncbi:hypothetical protein HDV02_005472 [Globomyces sp. JEL0801]|nr:hypothetical protein HDV02_005472 [Globomyces sp. JEL0801]